MPPHALIRSPALLCEAQTLWCRACRKSDEPPARYFETVRYGHEGATAQRLPVEVRLSGLSRIVKGRRAVIKAIRLPNSGARTVNTLPVIYDKVLDVRDDQVSLGLDSMELHEVYAMRVAEV